jgi:hypothetical protein
MTDNIASVAHSMADNLGRFVNEEQISPPEVVVGATRGAIAFWMGCVQDGTRVDALNTLRQGFNEEIDSMIRGISNGMVPA